MSERSVQAEQHQRGAFVGVRLADLLAMQDLQPFAAVPHKEKNEDEPRRKINEGCKLGV